MPDYSLSTEETIHYLTQFKAVKGFHFTFQSEYYEDERELLRNVKKHWRKMHHRKLSYKFLRRTNELTRIQ